MRELKLQLNIYSPRDYLRIEQHLAQMAAKGWQLEQIDNVFWRYRIAEPKKMRYSVLFFQNMEWEEPYREFCEKAGWTFVSGYAGMQIFCTEDPDLAPVEVAPTPRWKAIHKSVMSHDRLLWLGLGILALLVIVNAVITAISDPVEVLADAPRLMYILLMLGALLLILGDWLHYISWRNRARRQFNKAGTLPDVKGNLIGLCVGLAILLAVLIATLIVEDTYGRIVTLLNIASIVITLLAVSAYRLIKKRKSADTPVSPMMMITIALVVFLALGIVQSAMLSSWDIYCEPEDMDLTVQALTGQPQEEQSCLIEEQRSPVLEDLTGRNVVGEGEGQTMLQYRITKALHPSLVSFCHDNCLPAQLQAKLEAQDAALWQAEGVWLHVGSNGMYTYYVYFADRAATLMVSWELTPEQIAVASKALTTA